AGNPILRKTWRKKCPPGDRAVRLRNPRPGCVRVRLITVGRRLAVLALDPARAAAISVIRAVPVSERVRDPADGSATGAAAAPVARPRQRRIAFLRDRRLD